MAAELHTGSAEALWQSLVLESERCTGLRLEEELEAYLVFVLMRHARDGALLARVMAIELLAASGLVGRRRLEELRDVGDRCLLLCGWFPAQARRRRVSREYFARLGQSAYRAAAEHASAGYAALFTRLAEDFVRLSRVLAGVRAGAAPSVLPTLAAPVERLH
ncbi:MAG: hypothetical protein RML12_02365 [Xanthomonadales bacterium]|nr:hypothetical protein [Xanthomonadales bacterium]